MNREQRWLLIAATSFALAVMFHNYDHLRRGSESTSVEVFWAGSAAIILEVGAVLLVYGRHRLAPLAATAVGFPLALGYLVVHFTPERGFFSDSLVSGNGEALSLLAASLETFTALLLGLAGLNILRRQGIASAVRPTTAPAAEPSLLVGFRHPLVAVMAVANVVIFVLALAQR